MKLLKKIITSTLLFALISAPATYVSAAKIQPGLLDSPSNTAYIDSRDMSAFVKPAIGLGALILVGGVIALSSGGGGHHKGHDSSDNNFVHAHD